MISWEKNVISKNERQLSACVIVVLERGWGVHNKAGRTGQQVKIPLPRECPFAGSNWVFHDRHFCQIIWQIFTQGKAQKSSSKIAPSGDWNQDLLRASFHDAKNIMLSFWNFVLFELIPSIWIEFSSFFFVTLTLYGRYILQNQMAAFRNDSGKSQNKNAKICSSVWGVCLSGPERGCEQDSGTPPSVNGQTGVKTLPSLILWNAGGYHVYVTEQLLEIIHKFRIFDSSSNISNGTTPWRHLKKKNQICVL